MIAFILCQTSLRAEQSFIGMILSPPIVHQSDPVSVRVIRTGGCVPGGTTMAGWINNQIHIRHSLSVPAVAVPGTCEESFILTGGLPLGNHTVVWDEVFLSDPIAVFSIASAELKVVGPSPVPTISAGAIVTLCLLLLLYGRRILCANGIAIVLRAFKANV
jgi:hypothetical protein